MEENMSPKLDNTHPNLRLRDINDGERERIVIPDQQQQPQEGVNLDALVEDFVRTLIKEVLGEDDEEPLFLDDDLQIPTYKPTLTKDIWARVFMHVFNFGGKLVHCISRLTHSKPLKPLFLSIPSNQAS